MNGEIYNFRELRTELEAIGVVFQSRSDTEVLANALSKRGAGALRRVVGIYAFVALDLQRRDFVAGRDPIGVKPLYVIQSGDQYLFSSEIAPLLQACSARPHSLEIGVLLPAAAYGRTRGVNPAVARAA
jgi:asparagine synthase (glutamine-hydrolysing)